MTSGIILNTKRFEIHDGPGIRTTLFLKGCPLNCKWCHNPESFTGVPQLAYYDHKCVKCGMCRVVCPQNAHKFSGGTHVFDRELCKACGKCVSVCPAKALTLFGKVCTPDEIIGELIEDKPFFDESGGGVTISGGEPLFQPDFTAELLGLLRENGISTALDTSLYAQNEVLRDIADLTDIFLVDVKAINEDVHIKCTGVSNKVILENLKYLDKTGKKYEIRIPFVFGENSDEIESIARFLSELSNLGRVKVLKYHSLSRTKYAALGMDYRMGDRGTVSDKAYKNACEILKSFGIDVH